MKVFRLSVLFSCLVLPWNAIANVWKDECVSYYQLKLPENLEVAVYPVEDFVNPDERPASDRDIKVQRYATPKIAFIKNNGLRDRYTGQVQFSQFYYDKYELGISSESPEMIDFPAYIEKVKDDKFFWNNVRKQYENRSFRVLNKPVTPDAEFNRRYGYLIKEYPDAFTIYGSRGYTVYINKDNRLYHFWGDFQKETNDKSQTAQKQLRDNEPEVLSLLNRFQPRNLYEVPTEQGFCFPYGFIAGDSGHEKRNMGVTYRLKDHPDVTIFFQDLGMEPNAGKEKDLNEKDYVTWLWNWQYQWSSVSKELIRPKWRTIEMDGRKGVGTFVKSVFKDGRTDYGYVAYVQGNHSARNQEPDLLLYVMQYSRQAKGHPPMDKDELEKMAERIVRSVHRR
ncbi:MAG TPA: T6SS immunity protein Tli4 family protein [Buttiauxella sp.]|nr:T6SS immunity protein Tli4 family protein [Buttiauxella sp.]